jgi:hypothetical protein
MLIILHNSLSSRFFLFRRDRLTTPFRAVQAGIPAGTTAFEITVLTAEVSAPAVAVEDLTVPMAWPLRYVLSSLGHTHSF